MHDVAVDASEHGGQGFDWVVFERSLAGDVDQRRRPSTSRRRFGQRLVATIMVEERVAAAPTVMIEYACSTLSLSEAPRAAR